MTPKLTDFYIFFFVRRRFTLQAITQPFNFDGNNIWCWLNIGEIRIGNYDEKRHLY